MAHFRRRRPRIWTYRRGSRPTTDRFLRSWPAYHDILHHRRPRRRRESALLHAVLMGWADPDGLVWPPGNCRPHVHCW